MVKFSLMKDSPFEIERKRQNLASAKKYKELAETYIKKYPEIKDLNTPKLWDDIYSKDVKLSDQDGMTKDRIKTAVRFLPRKQIRVLDIGAGMGFIEELISGDKNINLYANDFSKRSLKILKKKYKGEFSLQSIYTLNYKPNFFDAVLILEVLEHIPPSKTFSVLSKVNLLMKIGGTLIVSVPMNEGLNKMKNNPSGHVRTYDENLIKVELEIAGFRVLASKTFFAFSDNYLFKKFVSKIIKRKNPNNIVIKAIKL